MGKQDAVGSGQPQNLDAFLRMNFLYQASVQQAHLHNPNLARVYAGIIRSIAERTVIRMYVNHLHLMA